MRISIWLIVTAFLCPVTALSQEWCAEPICARTEGTDVIRIQAPGRFETTFTRREGFGDQLFDLQADPGKLQDLSAVLTENGILWTKLLEDGAADSYSATNATSLEILEAEGVRVRVRHSGVLHMYGLPGMPWNDLGFVQTFTVYATGEVYVDYGLVAATSIELAQHDLILKTTSHWGGTEAQCIGEHGTVPPYDSTATPFAMVSSNGPTYFADILMAMYTGVHDGSYWNTGFPGHDYRCGLFVTELLSVLPAGTSHIPMMLRIAQDMNDAAAASKYADAYRSPDPAFTVVLGTQVLDDPGDRDGDGFNEEDGTYVLQRVGAQNVEFVLHADPGLVRPNPAFKIRSWNAPPPAVIWIGDTQYLAGGAFRASTLGPDLILQLLGDRTADTMVRIEGPAAQVPALPGLGGLMLAAALGATGARRIARRARTS